MVCPKCKYPKCKNYLRPEGLIKFQKKETSGYSGNMAGKKRIIRIICSCRFTEKETGGVQDNQRVRCQQWTPSRKPKSQETSILLSYQSEWNASAQTCPHGCL